jgi:hypothetical protein
MNMMLRISDENLKAIEEIQEIFSVEDGKNLSMDSVLKYVLDKYRELIYLGNRKS